jgi:tRNA-2-methylthio-N6-dimethylallyladenosine synthase
MSSIDTQIAASTELIEPSVLKNGKTYYIESYGCQMNVSDSEIVASVLNKNGFSPIHEYEQADIIFLNTCSIREKAEQTVRNRIKQFNQLKKKKKGLMIGVLGCMAERLKTKLLEEEKLVDLVAGPDVYRDLPNMISEVEGGQKAVNVLLSRDETYADISPVRLSSNGVTAFVSIMRGCDNMCSFCVVPFTRGRERSRSTESILEEVKMLVADGFKEVTLLGQNVDSYRWSEDPKMKGLKLIENKYAPNVVNFSRLLEKVAQVHPQLRVRFSTSHPKDMTDDVLEVMVKYPNICNYIHLPLQSGSSSCLERMNRTYDRDWYLDRIEAIKRIIPNCAISADIIAGFCGETEEEHLDTLSMMEYVKYGTSYMYYYSERPGTLAAKRYVDDVPEETKKRRLQEIVDLQNKHSLERNQEQIGKRQIVLIEWTAKKSKEQLLGRADSNKKVIVDKGNLKLGDYIEVEIVDCNSNTLFGNVIRKISPEEAIILS